jgi:hypothetical protein
VSRFNYFVFQPMLAEVVRYREPFASLDSKTRLYVREIESIDLDGKAWG